MSKMQSYGILRWDRGAFEELALLEEWFSKEKLRTIALKDSLTEYTVSIKMSREEVPKGNNLQGEILWDWIKNKNSKSLKECWRNPVKGDASNFSGLRWQRW
jgi:hypothetical protein